MVRSVLAILTSVGLAAAATTGCRIPSTLGLACTEDAHCDTDQQCTGDVCVAGEGTDSEPGTSSTSVEPGSSVTTAVDATGSESSASESSSSTSSSGSSSESSSSSSSSTGPACGIESCQDLDVLLLLDTSDSMTQWLITFANSLPSLFELFTEELGKVCTFHVGLATADAVPELNPKACQFPGALIHRPENCGGGDDVLPWLSGDDGTPSEVFDQAQCSILALGTNGSSDERMLESLLGAVDPLNNAKGACNDGFRRPGANLAILYISDENDPTPTDEQDTVAEAFQASVDPSLVAFISVVADPVNEDPECVWMPDGRGEGIGAEIPDALNGFLGLSTIPLDQQARVDICQSPIYAFDDAFMVFRSACGG